MMRTITLALISLIVMASPSGAQTTEPSSETTTEPSMEGVEPEPPPEVDDGSIPEGSSLEKRLEKLTEENETLKEQVKNLQEDQGVLERLVESLMPLSSKLGGYLDFGLFAVPGGDGSGIKADLGYVNFPEFMKPIEEGGGVPDTWVFMGDPLSTAINARGEPADTGESRAIVFDSVNNRGKLSFIVNTLNVSIFAGIGKHLTVNGVVDLVPRTRNVADVTGLFLGDFIDVKLAFAEYIVPVDGFQLSLFAGKVDPVLGIEYRIQESPDRISVTPSLICRYTCGRPLAVKARARFLDESLVAMVMVANGSSVVELFPFYNEIDQNNMKTISGRLSYKIPIGAGLEVGVSGAYGAEDLQTEDGTTHWHVGADLHLIYLYGLEVSAEVVRGKAEGQTETREALCETADCIDYKGAYGTVSYLVTNWLVPYVRVDWRDALHRSGANFVYISKLMRATGGLRFEIGTNVIVKGEYTINRELGRIPKLKNDVFTSALVIRY